MSELIDNAVRKKSVLKHLMLQLHAGSAPEAVRAQLARIMGEVPYDLVVEVEQELLADGLPASEILKFCDVHTQVLKGAIKQEPTVELPAGHPVHTFREENRALQWELDQLKKLFLQVSKPAGDLTPVEILDQITARFHALTDVHKHYRRKENLLFPYLEQRGVTGPSKVMWAKDDEALEKLKGAVEALHQAKESSHEEISAVIELVLDPAIEALEDMIYREEHVLFPMALDLLSESNWHAIRKQSTEIGFCLYDPPDDWTPAGVGDEFQGEEPQGRIQLPSGSLTPVELTALLNTISFDLTFVDKEDTVRYFTQGRERIFVRSRAILGRKVQLCHPPSSVHIVQQILDDFKSGRQSRAPFWIEMKGKFIHIEYFALRDNEGNYLGTLEVSQDLTEKRALLGEQRLLHYAEEDRNEGI